MSTHNTPAALRPRHGLVIKVLIVARISSLMQDRRSLDDQIKLCEQRLNAEYSGPNEIRTITSQGSGEYLDTKEFAGIISAIESRTLDLVLVEDLGRICRRSHANLVCELCEDMETRLISINDHVDTAKEGWRLNATFASMHHEFANRDTSARVKRSGDNRFRTGGSLSKIVFGYIKPNGANDIETQKDPEAIPVFEHLFQMIESGSGFAEMSAWLNQNKVPTGQHTRNKVWTARIVSRLIRNPILKGIRIRNVFKTKRINRTGRKLPVRNAESDWIRRECPNLAFIEATRYDRAIALLEKKCAEAKARISKGMSNPRYAIARTKTDWPGQHIRCGVCGNPMYWNGRKIKKGFNCALARDFGCWNGIRPNSRIVTENVGAALLNWLEAWPGFEVELTNRIRQGVEAKRSDRTEHINRIERELTANQKKIDNLLDALEKTGQSPALLQRLREFETTQHQLTNERLLLLNQPSMTIELPPSDELKAKAKVAVSRLAVTEPEFGRLMREMIPEFHVLPYQSIDGGSVVPRGHLRVDLSPFISGTRSDEYRGLATTELIVDLFCPPNRIRHRIEIMKLTRDGDNGNVVAAKLGITPAAVHRARKLTAEMERRGLSDPYEMVTEPPGEGGRTSRHLSTRFQFRPREGFPIWKQQKECRMCA